MAVRPIPTGECTVDPKKLPGNNTQVGDGDGEGGQPPAGQPPAGQGGGTGASGDGGGTGSAGGGQSPGGDDGYPANTPIAEMTPEQQVAYWKAQARKHEARVKQMSDYDALKETSDQYRALVEASKTEQEKALDAAKAEAREAAKVEFGARLVDAQFKVAASGRLDEQQMTTLLDGLDRTRFMTSTGDVDADKVKTYVEGIAPVKPQGQTHVDMGQGRRQGSTAPTVETGAALYAERHPAKHS